MNAHTRIPCETDPGAEAWRRRWLERQMEKLERLAEVGLGIAEAIGRQVEAAADPACGDPAPGRREAAVTAGAMAYARAARAVRMTVALQSRLMKLADETQPGDEARADRPAISISWTQDVDAAQAAQAKRVQRIVRRIAEDAAHDREACERLAGEAAEQLRDEDLYGDLMRRPLGEVLAHICRDLGLDPDWERLAQEAWAKEEIRGGDPGSPFAAWMTGARPASPPRDAGQGHKGRRPG